MSGARDLAVVGGGPVGLATAICARGAGLSVAVFDQRRPPIDKACGEGLMPDGVELLTAMGVELGPEAARPFAGIRYLDGERSAEARFAAGHGLGARRPVLHAALAARAEELGAELHWGTRVEGLVSEGLETSAGPVAARWMIGADGLASRVRRWAGLEGRPARVVRFGRRRHYAVKPWSDLVEVYWGDGHEAYVTPVGESEVGVAMLWRSDAPTPSKTPGTGPGATKTADTGPRARKREGTSPGTTRTPSFEAQLAAFPRLAKRLTGAEVTSADRGAGPFYRLPRRVRSGRVMLVGDAAGYLDAITGEGLALGFQQARALVRSVAAGRPAGYEAEVRRLTRTPFGLIRLLLLVERRPGLRRRVVATLDRDPELFARLLAVHARQARPRDLGLGGPARLLRGLLTA